MDVFTIALICVRRWYVLLPLLAITASLAVLQGRTVEAQYSANATAIVVASNSTPRQGGDGGVVSVNPLASASTAQAALVARLNSSEVAAIVTSKTGGSGGFSAVAQKSASIIGISTVATTARGASETLSAAQDEIPTQLQKLQADLGVPSDSYYRAVALTGNQGVSVDYPDRAKSVALVALSGILLSILLTQLIDTLEKRRRRSRPRRRTKHDGDEISAAEDAESVSEDSGNSAGAERWSPAAGARRDSEADAATTTPQI